MLAHLLGEVLNGAILPSALQPVDDGVGQRQRFGDGHGLALQLALPFMVHLYKKQGVHHHQHRGDNGGHHQRDRGAELQRKPWLGHENSPEQVATRYSNGERGRAQLPAADFHGRRWVRRYFYAMTLGYDCW